MLKVDFIKTTLKELLLIKIRNKTNRDIIKLFQEIAFFFTIVVNKLYR